jgi:hypothetical protein
LHLPKIDSTAIDTVVLSKGHDTARVVRVAPGQWRVNGYPAALDAISALERGLADTSASSEEVSENKASRAVFGVGADSGQHVRVLSRGRTIIDVITGRPTSEFGGLYVRPVDSDLVYALHGGLADALNRSVTDWRDRHIASVAPDSVSGIAVQRGDRSYTLRRDRGDWHFGTGGPADSSAVGTMLSQYRDLMTIGFARPGEADTAALARARTRVKLTNSRGTSLLSLRFDSATTRVWARADTGGPIFGLNIWSLPQLLPADSALKPRKKTPAAPRSR